MKKEQLVAQMTAAIMDTLALCVGQPQPKAVCYGEIGVCAEGVVKITFLYDNDKSYTAAGVEIVDFNVEDILGNITQIEYSANCGVKRVDREDLAAITVHYEDGTIVMHPLMNKVVMSEVTPPRMQRKSQRTPAGTAPNLPELEVPELDSAKQA